MSEYDDVDIETLLGRLSADELEELNNDCDPDVECICVDDLHVINAEFNATAVGTLQKSNNKRADGTVRSTIAT